MNEPLSPEREQEIRETQLGNWYDGPWTQGYVEGSGDDPAYYRVKHAESGTTLATLPDWAGPIALFIADAHDAVPELLAELDRVRAERDQYATQLDGLHLAQWEDKQEAEQAAAIDRLRQDNRAAHASEQILQQQIDAQAKEIDRLRTMYAASSGREHELIEERDRLRGELAQTVEHRDHWHAELMCADARILELGRQAEALRKGGA